MVYTTESCHHHGFDLVMLTNAMLLTSSLYILLGDG